MNASNAPKPIFTTRSIVRAGLVAAVYVVLTLVFQPISFSQNSPLQFRIAEALTLLPILTFDAVPGLFVGCLLGNLLGQAAPLDVLFGSLSTLLAAVCTRMTRNKPVVAASFPAIFNGLIVGPLVYFLYTGRTGGAPVEVGMLLLCIGAVALGEVAVCYALGLPILYALKKLPEDALND